MAVEKLQEYIDSVADLESSYAKVIELREIVGTVSRYLITAPYKMTVSNVGVSFTVTSDREYTLNGDKWPSAKQIAEILSDYISKRGKTKMLYSSLSGTQRSSVKPPPEM